MLERLPTPWGLVRLGVAPDHPKLKTVSRAFERIALKPGFRFFGNVEVGRDLTHADLTRLYDAVVYAFGAQSDRRLDIPGEDLPGSLVGHRVRRLVQRPPGLPGAAVRPERRTRGRDRQRQRRPRRRPDAGADTGRSSSPTDTTDPAIEAIGGATIRDIVVVGRRGPAQASWTTPELKELGELAGADVVVDPAELELDAVSEASLEDDTQCSSRTWRSCAISPRASPTGKPVTVRLRFLASPVALHGDEQRSSRSSSCATGSRSRMDVSSPFPTDERETIECGLVFRSVGYRGVGLPELPFDERRGTIRNERGRVVADDGEPRRPVRIAPAGSSAARRGSSAPTRRTRPRRSPSCSRTSSRGSWVTVTRRPPLRWRTSWPNGTPGRSCTRAGPSHRRARAGRREKLGRPRVKLRTWDELLEAAERVAAETA